ncbi:cytosolic endo-beta-N-acetylglucosaminidase isoform X2 [Sitodiplosis mosellana]|uniref:cytosolic endo-beta-N-acetylglucosaminidase isoform X2 n=1 Tax=Sitodiplosis mosellana TaxID=263140 RepID=UPI002444C576|nr:cytosolic endo-beta-N-acetylglucosaminidase isoform X2 [Sitodiplosis mosellana]
MFSFIRWMYRRIFILVVLFVHNFFEFVNTSILDDHSHWLQECAPFRTNQQLLDYTCKPFSWNSLVEPCVTRCNARKYGEHFEHIQENVQNITEPNERTRPKVLVCHDMAGNYRGDRFLHGSRKYDDYRFYHWAGIDLFNYFSHNYITIPPLCWINAGHRNGVQVLGTIIIEFDEAKKILDELLHSRQDLYRFAEAFVLVTKNFGFDGWLLNIECGIAADQVPKLKEFVRQLTKRIHEEIPNGVVIWYDSVIESGSLRWQNEVNEENIDMYQGTDGILLNYWWSRQHLERTVNILRNDPEELAKVFVGIDVFGRGQSGGFHTHETLRPIKDYNLSIGIFAPGWTFENMPDEHPMRAEGTDNINTKFLKRNTRFWSLLWTQLYSRGPNTLPFYTSFCLGSGKKQYRNGLQIGNEPWFNLLEQQYQPSVPSHFEYQFEEAYHGGSCIKFVETVRNIRLFATDFSLKDNLIASFVFKRSDPAIDIQLVLNVQNGKGDQSLLVYCNSDIRNKLNAILKPCERHVNPLRRNLLKYTVVGLSNRHEKIFPSSNRAINGWETRYYYLNFDGIAKLGRIVDIGVSINKENNWNENDSVLLGALHIHCGIKDEERITAELDPISFNENGGFKELNM